jgi:hypothetical protein
VELTLIVVQWQESEGYFFAGDDQDLGGEIVDLARFGGEGRHVDVILIDQFRLSTGAEVMNARVHG